MSCKEKFNRRRKLNSGPKKPYVSGLSIAEQNNSAVYQIKRNKEIEAFSDCWNEDYTSLGM